MVETSGLWIGRMDFEATSAEIESNGPMVQRGRECRRSDWHVIDKRFVLIVPEVQ